MKVQIRRSVFETNSSSTHSLTLTSSSNWEKFKNGEYVATGFPYELTFVDASKLRNDQIYNKKKIDEGKEFYDCFDYFSYDALNHIWNTDVVVEKMNDIVGISIYQDC